MNRIFKDRCAVILACERVRRRGGKKSVRVQDSVRKPSFFFATKQRRSKQTMLFGSVVKRSAAERNEAANTFRDGFDRRLVPKSGK